MVGELLEAERVRSIVAAFFTVYNYSGGGGMCEAAYTGPQLIGYLRATRFQVGVLLHFGPPPKFYRFVDTRKKIDPDLDRIRSHSRNSRPEALVTLRDDEFDGDKRD